MLAPQRDQRIELDRVTRLKVESKLLQNVREHDLRFDNCELRPDAGARSGVEWKVFMLRRILPGCQPGNLRCFHRNFEQRADGKYPIFMRRLS